MPGSHAQRAFGALGLVAIAAALAGCGESTSPPVVTTEISVGPGEYAVLGGSAIGVRLPAAGPSGAAYLVVGQLAAGTGGPLASLRLGGAAVSGAGPLLAYRPPSAAERFHGMLRLREQELARRAPLGGALVLAPPPRVPPPVLGQKRAFKVCADLDCSSTTSVPATVQWVGTHAAIFVDDSVPGTLLPVADVGQLGAQFDTVLHPIASSRFGSESDIDGNGVVLVLLTRQVNRLVPRPDCQNAFVTGYFYGGDISPVFRAQYNNGEVFYGMVPDPGSATTCDMSLALVKRVLPITFIHEFQHMISFNQHVLVRSGSAEVLWLNEALSHLAEELAGLHYDSLGDNTTASRFLVGNLYNAYHYLEAPNEHALVTDAGTGTLEERGAFWLFARYLVDRYGAAVTRTLVETQLVDVPNVRAAAGGTAMESLLTRWALALYVSDLPGFSAPAPLRYESWRFRTTFASLHAQNPATYPRPFPLEPDSGVGAQVLLSGGLGSGSGAYVMPQQPADGTSFDLTFRVSFPGGTPPGGGGPQLTVLRLR